MSKATLVQLGARDLHFLLAVIGNVGAFSEIEEIADAGRELQRDYPDGTSGVIGLFKKLAHAHDEICGGVPFVPIAKLLEDAVRDIQQSSHSDLN